MESGARSSGPAITESSMATSRTLRPIGPAECGSARYTSPPGPAGTRPNEGRNPTTLLNAAGLRSEPMKSLPSATGNMRSASDAAAPPLLPPDVFDCT